jgi:hypothetical protein
MRADQWKAKTHWEKWKEFSTFSQLISTFSGENYAFGNVEFGKQG